MINMIKNHNKHDKYKHDKRYKKRNVSWYIIEKEMCISIQTHWEHGYNVFFLNEC